MPLLDNLDAFLHGQPGMGLKPSQDGRVHIKGRLKFSASYDGSPTVEDCYQIHIVVFPEHQEKLPEVYEIGDRVPRDGDHHVNPDGSLCLGSPIRLHTILRKGFSLTEFVDRCLIPFLYATSLAELGHERFRLGELPHGTAGLIEDYAKLFGCTTRADVVRHLETLTLKKRRANKKRCPCLCGQKLVKCRTHKVMVMLRATVPKKLFKESLAAL
ncbi:hypothetical protein M2D07_016190 [Pseudomonas sp. BGr12]|uniref:hypothetical protein n=1 Tax=Pseudomonas sp. BGr12 TaxID=2936269 RepID=UPI002559CE5F|nr:hypothetical protein [Pseudomonas sp. BJa5]MDL2428557.1 hypothetical protein [Pseudomonas sp. BJa5]